MPANKRKYWIAVAICCGLSAQTPKLEFEVASVRPSGPRSPDETPADAKGATIGGPGTSSPGRITYSRVSLQRLLMIAYGVQPDQISGPEWLGSEHFDIIANVARGTTPAQVNLMLQDLLTERFKVKLHHASKDLPGYELSVAKTGFKLKEVAATTAPRPKKPSAGAYSKKGLQHRTCLGCSIPDLIEQLSIQLAVATGDKTYSMGRVMNKTGLTGRYDFVMEYAGSAGVGGAIRARELDSAAGLGPDLFGALESLGLKLEKTKAPVDELVIEHVEKVPTDN